MIASGFYSPCCKGISSRTDLPLRLLRWFCSLLLLLMQFYRLQVIIILTPSFCQNGMQILFKLRYIESREKRAGKLPRTCAILKFISEYLSEAKILGFNNLQIYLSPNEFTLQIAGIKLHTPCYRRLTPTKINIIGKLV